jgi:hypothetical protein
MPQLRFEPATLVLGAAPGQTRQSITIRDAPMDAGVTAAIPAGPFVVDEIVIFQQVLRPFTEEEIEQLPPHPPSIREKAREQGGFVTEETARSDGTTPLPVPAGATVFVTVRLATKDAPDIAATTLVLDGASWGRIEVPVVVMSARDRAGRHPAEPIHPG